MVNPVPIPPELLAALPRARLARKAGMDDGRYLCSEPNCRGILATVRLDGILDLPPGMSEVGTADGQPVSPPYFRRSDRARRRAAQGHQPALRRKVSRRILDAYWNRSPTPETLYELPPLVARQDFISQLPALIIECPRHSTPWPCLVDRKTLEDERWRQLIDDQYRYVRVGDGQWERRRKDDLQAEWEPWDPNEALR